MFVYSFKNSDKYCCFQIYKMIFGSFNIIKVLESTVDREDFFIAVGIDSYDFGTNSCCEYIN